MARISFEVAQETENQSTNNSNNVGFFTLKNDGDEAIVRIMHDSTADFDIITCHPVKVGDKFRKVNCIRDPRDPMDNCPLCANGAQIQQRFFIHMIQYEKDAQGQVTAKPVVWERAAGDYGVKLKTLIEEYGPLSDVVFKIRRNGKAGDMNTTYEILFGNPSIYRPDLYPKKPELFEGYSACGTIVIDRDYNDIAQFVATGSFPQAPSNNQATAPVNTAQAARAAIDVVVDDAPPAPAAYPQPAYPVAPNTNQRAPWEAPASGGYAQPASGAPSSAPARPTRYY